MSVTVGSGVRMTPENPLHAADLRLMMYIRAAQSEPLAAHALNQNRRRRMR